MRITRDQLQGLIDEEITRALLRSENRRLTEGPGDGARDPSPADLVRFAKSYMRLGVVAREQLDEVLQMNYEGVDPGSLTLIKRSLLGESRGLDTMIRECEQTLRRNT